MALLPNMPSSHLDLLAVLPRVVEHGAARLAPQPWRSAATAQAETRPLLHVEDVFGRRSDAPAIVNLRDGDGSALEPADVPLPYTLRPQEVVEQEILANVDANLV